MRSLRPGLYASTAAIAQVAATAAATTAITSNGITASLQGERTTGQYVDGSYWVIAPDNDQVTFLSRAIEAGTEAEENAGETCLYLGQAMIDPGASGVTNQGFDDRLNTNSRGPGLTYNAGVAVDFPFTVGAYPDGSPKTVWLYRGRDAVVVGSEESGAYSIAQITLVAAAPAANAIKPTGIYVSGGKPTYTEDDINYNLYTPVAIPSGSTEPDWTQLDGYLKQPLTRFGTTVNFAFIAPQRTEETYPAYQTHQTGNLVLGALSNSTSRNELINRIVRTGLDVKALAELGGTAYVANGGFGVGGKLLWFFAQKFLEEVWTPPSNITYAGNSHEHFQEDSTVFLGEPDVDWLLGKPLWGSPGQGYPDGPFPNNHITRDVNGLKEPHWMPHHSATVVAATSTTITLDATELAAKAAAGWPAPFASNRIYIVSGTGAGQYRTITNWDNGTKVATVAAWDVTPDGTSVYELHNGGLYQTIAMTGQVLAAMSVHIADEVADWNKPEFFHLVKRWIDDDGLLVPHTPPGANMSTFARNAAKWADGDGVWGKKFWDTYCASNWLEQAASNLAPDPGFDNASAWSLPTGWTVGSSVLTADSSVAAFATAAQQTGFRTPVTGNTSTALSLECLTVTTGKRVRLLVVEYDALTGGNVIVASTVRYDTGVGVNVAVGTLTATPWTTHANTTHIQVRIEATGAALEATFDNVVVTQ